MRLFVLAGVAAATAVIGALRMIAAPSPELPPLHPELLAPKTVTISATATPESRVTVPSLWGLTLDEAIQTLCRAGLETNPLVMSGPASPDMVDKVVAQDPAAGAVVDRGTQVGFALGEKSTPPVRHSGAR